ncbi:MAG: anthranilate synthase component 1 [Pantoea sp. Brub]|nr:anthranilate synthase component 1 [Pantoea sp. Brub]
MIHTKPMIKLITREVKYCSNPTLIFYRLCNAKPATLLLESADINNKKNLKSLLIIDSAVHITALDRNVFVKALSVNGLKILSLLDKILPSIIQNEISTNKRKLTFPISLKVQDEDNRLKSLSIFDVLRLMLQLFNVPINNKESFLIGGLFSYDLISNFEDIPKLTSKQCCPDYCFYLSEVLLKFDHQEKKAFLYGSIFCSSNNEVKRLENRIKQLQYQITKKNFLLPNKTIKNMKLVINQSDEEYCNIIIQMKNKILLGEIFQIVPSRRFFLPCPCPLSAYNILKINNLSPYMFFMQDYNFSLFGASPESFLKYNSNSCQIEIYPIAGTRPRGYKIDGSLDLDLDTRIELEMRTNHKELAEHIMLVDLARNDLARICIPGTRYVTDLIKVDRYSFVMHLVSRVIGILRNDLDVLHAYRACMNMGTVTGAPKIRAMQLIAASEGTKRGSYGGAIGYLTAHGDMDTCIVIRSAYIEKGIATVQSGAGIVLDSDPQSEADESRNKARAVLKAIAIAHNCKDIF